MESKVRYLRNPRCAGRIISGEAFVVTPGDNKLHRLNDTATCIWNTVSEGPKSLDELVEALLKEFNVEKAVALDDSRICVTDFIERKIIVTENSSE